MKNIIRACSGVLLLLAFICMLQIQNAYSQASAVSPALSKVLVAQEDTMFRIITTGNRSAAETLFAPDYITINADGVMQTQAETLREFGKFKGSTYKFLDKKIRVYDNIAIITGRAKFYIKSILAADVFYTETWIHRSNRWQFIGWQGTMTGLPAYYPIIVVVILALIVCLIAGVITKRKRKRSKAALQPTA